MDDYKSEIGKRIETALSVSGKKQKDLAEYLGILPNTISYFCKGTRTPNTEQIIKIAKFLDVSADYLLGLSKAMTVETDIKAICKFTGLSEEAVKILAMEKKNDDIIKVINFLLVRSGLQYTLTKYFTTPLNKPQWLTFDKDGSLTATTVWVEEECFEVSSNEIINKILFDRVCDNVKHAKMLFDRMYRKESEDNGEHNTPKE